MSGDFGVPGAAWGPRLSEEVLGSEAQKGSPTKGLGKEQEPSKGAGQGHGRIKP